MSEDNHPSKKNYGPSLTSHDWHHENCFGCGPDNKCSLDAPFTFDTQSGEVRFSYTIPARFEGAPGYSHGGILATLLDEAQGCLCFHLGHFVMTDQLYMSYHKATPLEQTLEVRAWLTLVRRKRLYTKGTLHTADGELLASSKARWYILPPRIRERIFAGRVSAEEAERTRLVTEANRNRQKAIRKRLREEKKRQNQP